MSATLSEIHPSPVNVAREIERLRQNLNAALRGKSDVIELVLSALLARGHLLIEDLPGLGKTTLAKAIAASIGGRFARVQCTPDLLPGDITGFSVFNQQSRALEFVPGPVFADVLLADEINRATPRTQSALLEVMAEHQVTVDNVTRPLTGQFLVIATQNPIELDGTFPLPEAQLDRFAMKLRIGYLEHAYVVQLLADSIGVCDAAPPAGQVLSREEFCSLQHRTAAVTAGPRVLTYLADLGEAIRRHPRVRLGASPRGLLIWLRLAQAWALLQTRDFVTPDDLQSVALAVLEVRLIVDGRPAAEVIQEILDATPAPIL